MNIVDQPWFSKIRRPSRYLGREINIIQKDPEYIDVKVALAFPDVYEVGMSHLGLKILYHILNGEQWLAAERVFAPWPDLEKELRYHQIPLCTLESNTPLRDCHIVGFSLQHELCFTNVVNMLDLGKIPIAAGQRDEDTPIIIAGGPACFNPEPIAMFFDLIVVGDGEEIFLQICKKLRDAKKSGAWPSKQRFLEELRFLKGVYIPSFFSPRYAHNGTIKSIAPSYNDYNKVQKAIVPAIDLYPAPSRQLVPYAELIHDRLAVEIARGCGRGCRFCQAGMIYRPVREKPIEKIISEAQEALKATGYEDLSLLSLSTGDYSCIEPLLETLMNKQEQEKIAISLPSLRIDSLSPAFFEQIKRVRKTGFTLAVEAGNERLRSIINKGLSDREILDMAKLVYGAGWNLIKLYFMIGLPFEQGSDLLDIIHLARQVIKVSGGKGRPHKLNVSVATFVPKSHTPFMWVKQLHLEEAKERIELIHNKLKGSSIRVKWNQPEMSWLEGIFSRGDRRLGNAIKKAWELGARFDAWGEYFSKDLWEKALYEVGLEPDFYLYRERRFEEVLPWDHISTGVTKDFLKSEWEKARSQTLTPDCRVKCTGCGVCDHKNIMPVIIKGKGLFIKQKEASSTTSAHAPEHIRKYRLHFAKSGVMRHLSHLELVRLISRALRRAQIPLAYSKGFHPTPKISFSSALPVGTETLKDTFDMQVTRPLDLSEALKNINLQLPQGIEILDIFEVPPNTKAPRIKEATFLCVAENGSPFNQGAVENFLKSREFMITKQTKKGGKRLDLKKLVKSISRHDSSTIKVTLDYQQGQQVKPEEVIKAVFPLKDLMLQGIRISKVHQKLIDETDHHTA